MSNTLTVQDPEEGTAEIAAETRAKLQEWVDKHLPDGDDGGVEPLSDSDIKDLRAAGVECLAQGAGAIAGRYSPASEFGKLLAGFAYSSLYLTDRYPQDARPRELSHAFEGAVREFHKQFFQAGMKWNLHAEYLAALCLHAPHRTTGDQDRLLNMHLGCVNSSRYLSARHDSEASSPWSGLGAAFGEYFNSIQDWAISQTIPNIGSEGKEHWVQKLMYCAHVGVQIHYMDEDGPWVAGFLNLSDACRMRFRRVRLGAYLTEQGLTDAAVRQRVELAKQVVAGARFVAWPNDTRWEGVYTSGPNSCMSSEASDYQCWDDLHPVDAYSSSFHGCGDNNLVLLTSVDGDGNTDGRGILNLQHGTIVRWYGNNVAERVLLRNGVDVSHRRSMDGTWLALLEQGKRFIHPYVDGDIAYGEVSGVRVYIVDDSDQPCLQETGGSSYQGGSRYCVDTQSYEDADECTYQEIQGNYISDNCGMWRCPVIDEFADEDSRTWMDLHGVSVLVSDHVYYDKGRYLTQCDNGWSIDDDDVRAAFFEAYDIDEDEPEDDEEEAA